MSDTEENHMSSQRQRTSIDYLELNDGFDYLDSDFEEEFDRNSKRHRLHSPLGTPHNADNNSTNSSSFSEESPSSTEIFRSNVFSNTRGSTSTRERAKSSLIWKHMDKIKINEEEKVQCRYCNYIGTFTGPTSNHKKHLMNKHNITKSNSVPLSAQTLKQAIIKFIIMNDMPFNIVEQQAFQQLLITAGCGSKDKIPIRCAKVVRDIIMQHYEVSNEELVKKLQLCSTIAISLDCWTSPNDIAFLGIVGHWISEGFEYEEYVIDFVKLKGEHTGNNLAYEVKKSLQKLQCSNKLIAVTGDNASNNKTLSEKLLELLPRSRFEEGYLVNCLNHTIALICKDVLNDLNSGTPFLTKRFLDDQTQDHVQASEETSSPIRKIRTLALYVKRSPQRVDKWKESCTAVEVQPKFIQTDVITRWNSTYRMINDAIQLKPVIEHYIDHNYNLDSLKIRVSEWKLLEHVQRILGLFSEFTDFLSQKEPLLSISLQIYYGMVDTLIDMSQRREEFADLPDVVVNSVLRASAHFHDYYTKVDANDAYFIASFLDPRYKSRWLEMHIDLDIAKNIKQQMIIKLKQKYSSDSTVLVEESVPDIPRTTAVSSLLKRVYCIASVSKDQSDIDQYFIDPNVPNYEGFHLLRWWKENKTRYPLMSRVACDYLAIAATSTSVERMFNGGRDVIGIRRCSLNAESITALMFLKSYYAHK
jgi:hypothetical protein